jgi:hypothetical protein
MSRLRRGRQDGRYALILCLTCCGCSSPAVDASDSQRTGAHAGGWMAEAETDSRQSLEDRCGEHAPMDLVWTKHPDYLACTDRAERAVRDEWEALTRAAVEQCVSSGGTAGCCFARRSADAEFKEHLAACTRECASRVKGPVDGAPVCHSVVVVAATMTRFHTRIPCTSPRSSARERRGACSRA